MHNLLELLCLQLKCQNSYNRCLAHVCTSPSTNVEFKINIFKDQKEFNQFNGVVFAELHLVEIIFT